MIVLINFNSYLGGGETLFVRMADYFNKKNIECHLFFKKDSYIESDLRKHNVSTNLHPINLPVDYYYLGNKQRKQLRESILQSFDHEKEYELFTFCARDLYLTSAITKVSDYRLKLVHLILHDQDNLYCCQTLLDKIKLKLGFRRSFSSKKMIELNAALFNEVNKKGVLIPMSEVIVELWKRYYINICPDSIVPLPTCSFGEYNFTPINNKRILWVGRLVDFKIPSLCAMLNFLKLRPDYRLSIVGYGAEDFVNKYVAQNGINISQIEFLGKVDYDKLGNIIKQHSIGYAMGTSIIEMAQYGIPVIMALASPSYKLFDKDACGGLYVNKSLGNVGVDLFLREDLTSYPTIDETISLIESRYEESAKDCYETIRQMFDFETNVRHYLQLCKDKKQLTKIELNIPAASYLRKIAWSCFN